MRVGRDELESDLITRVDEDVFTIRQEEREDGVDAEFDDEREDEGKVKLRDDGLNILSSGN